MQTLYELMTSKDTSFEEYGMCNVHGNSFPRGIIQPSNVILTKENVANSIFNLNNLIIVLGSIPYMIKFNAKTSLSVY